MQGMSGDQCLVGRLNADIDITSQNGLDFGRKYLTDRNPTPTFSCGRPCPAQESAPGSD